MKIDIVQRKADMEDEKINVIIESNQNNPYTDDFADYIKQFNKARDKIISKNNMNKVMAIDGDRVKAIDYQEIICFYSNNKNVYCRTKDKNFRIKSSLCELEKVYTSFVRTSKNCIINTNHAKRFEMNAEGRMVVIFDDGTEERVARRRIKQVEKFLDERRI